MFKVYIIRSIKHPERFYIGYTTNLKNRLDSHNSGQSAYTSKYKPWELEFFACFNNKMKALDFEKYLKTPSGKAFRNKRLIHFD